MGLSKGRVLTALGAAACGVALVGCSSSTSPGDEDASGSRDVTLVAANYGGSTAEALASVLERPYTKETGTKFQQVPVGQGFAAKLQAQSAAGNVDWSVIEGLSGSDAAQLDSMGLLEHLPAELEAKLKEVSLPGTVTPYGVALGDTGYVIACGEKVAKCPTNPAEFWDTKSFPGKRAVPNAAPAMLAEALVADGVDVDEVYPIDVDRAMASLQRLRPSIDVFTTSGDQQMQVMRDGQVDMSIMWNGRAKGVIDQGTKLRLEWGGSLVNPNYMVVVKGGPNVAESMKYLEFYATHPQVQADLAAAMAYGMSHKDSISMMDPADADLLPAAHLDGQLRLQPEWWVTNSEKVNPLWTELMAG